MLNTRSVQTNLFNPGWFPRLSAALLLLVLAAVSPIQISAQQPTLKRLTLTQVEDLVAHGVPDSTLGAQIKRRGITFRPTPSILKLLQSKGVGPLTLEAISHERPPAPGGAQPSPPAIPPQRSTKMSKTELDHLFRIHASDAFIARQIRSRGLNFPLTQADVTSLSDKGAGPSTLAALSALVITGNLQLYSQPGATVSLDGNPVGVTNDAGVLQLQDLMPGQHTLVLTKDGYQTAHQSFTVTKREAENLSVPLQWTGGYLTVSAQPENATITIEGPQSFSGPQNNVACPPGQYTISVTDQYYFPQTRIVQIAQGSNIAVAIHLRIDPAYINGLLIQAKQLLEENQDGLAANYAREALQLSPEGNLRAASILAEAAFQAGDERDFINETRTVLSDGGTVTVPMMHLHTFFGVKIEPVQMIFSGQGLSFSQNPSDRKDKLPPSLRYSEISLAQARRLPSGTLELLIGWTANQHNQLFATMHNIELVTGGSQVFGSGNGIVQSPSTAWQQLNGLASLLEQLHQ